ncbi:PREDICTED: pre T-cell antigen receptor alpha isoform X1 [Chinchilla lanigera]|uniref:pre T-cell antigen receptor alpha isoform X1 n=1 Tax=Chinchilla lanigera TaxID=34839 RepID=UPI0006986A91|nr:PREDICTED: pre T-cell antigen receptor alpha isoform X1 [Chinchilla lanigera]
MQLRLPLCPAVSVGHGGDAAAASPGLRVSSPAHRPCLPSSLSRGDRCPKATSTQAGRCSLPLSGPAGDAAGGRAAAHHGGLPGPGRRTPWPGRLGLVLRRQRQRPRHLHLRPGPRHRRHLDRAGPAVPARRGPGRLGAPGLPRGARGRGPAPEHAAPAAVRSSLWHQDLPPGASGRVPGPGPVAGGPEAAALQAAAP